jgi:hypothetical protein
MMTALRCLQVKGGHSPGEPPGAPRSVVLRAEGAAPVVGRAAQQGRTPTGGLDDFVKPAVHGLGQSPIGQDG